MGHSSESVEYHIICMYVQYLISYDDTKCGVSRGFDLPIFFKIKFQKKKSTAVYSVYTGVPGVSFISVL